MREYDRIAAWYADVRDPEVGLPDLKALARTLPPGACVLDVGCGHGIPVSRFLVEQGFRVTGLDSSPEMIARYRVAVPGAEARCEDVRSASFEPASFDAVVAWGVLFHLSPADQVAVLQSVSGWLRPSGRLLFTSGDTAGEAVGTMDGVAFRYDSLGVPGYRRALEQAGLVLEASHDDAWDNHVYVARKPA